MNKSVIILFAFAILILLIFAGLLLGSELLNPSEVWYGLLGYDIVADSNIPFVIQEIRVPRVLTAVLSGAALGVGGLLMQSYFRNALAGPYILGVSAGAGLGIAFLLLASVVFALDLSGFSNALISFSVIGSAITLGIVMLISKKIGNGPMLLIAGLMIGSFASAMVSILQYFAPSEAIKRYLLWTMGSLTSVDLSELLIFSTIIIVFIFAAALFANQLNAFLLGETQAKTLGVSTMKVKWIVMTITGVLAGLVTAYCGPIAFVGLTGPHIARLLLNSQNHHILIPFTAVISAIVLLSCDIIAQLPGLGIQLPINAVTSLIGAPIVVIIIMNKNKMSNA